MNQALLLHDTSKPARQNDARASTASSSAHLLFLLLQREHAASISVLYLFQLEILFRLTISCLSLFSYVTYMYIIHSVYMILHTKSIYSYFYWIDIASRLIDLYQTDTSIPSVVGLMFSFLALYFYFPQFFYFATPVSLVP